jgi:hypothetical protein
MNFFNWDLMFLLPIHFVKMLLANGVIFDNEHSASVEIARKITDKTNQLLDFIVKESTHFRNKRPSEIGASIIYCARKE